VEFSTVHRSPILGAAVDTEHGLIAAISLEARFSVHDLSGTTLWSTRLGLAVDGGGAVRLGQGRFAMVWEGAGSWLWDLRTGRRLRRRQGIVFAHATALAAWMTDLEELCIEPLIPSPPDPFEESLCAHPTSIEGYPVLLAFSPDDAHLFASVSHHLALLRATEDTSVPGATIGAVVQESELGGEWCTATFAGDTIAALDRGGRAVILDASTLALRGERTLPPLGEDELETMLPDGPCVEAEVRIEEALALFRWHPGRPWVALDLASGAPRDVPSAMRARLPSTFADAVTVGTRRVALRSSGGEHAIHQLAFVSGGLVVLGREGALWVEEDGARPTTCLVGEVPLTRTRGGVRLVQGEGACDPTTDTGTASPPMPDDLDFVPEDPDVRSCSPDGADVCLLDREGERALVTRVRHRVLRRLDRDGEVRGASFSPDGSRVGLLMADGQVRVHRVEDGERIAAVPGTSIAAWSSSPTPSWLVTVLEADLLVHDLAGGQPVLRLSGATRAASDDTGSRLAYLRAPELHVIDWASRADSVVPASPPPSAQDLSFAGDRITLAGEGQLFSYALTGGAPLYLREVLSASDPSISPIVFHCPDEHTLRAIDLRTAQPLGDYPIACDSSLFYDGSIGTESFSHTSDGRILAYVDRREQVRLVRMSDGAELWLRLWSGPGTVHVVASALDGAFAVIAGGPEGFLLRDRLLPIGRARMVDPAHAEGLHRPTLVSDFFRHRAPQVAHRPAGVQQRRLIALGLAHHEPAVAQLLHQLGQLALLLVLAEPLHHPRAIRVGLEAPDHPGAGVAQRAVVQIHRVLGREHAAHAVGARLLHQGHERLLGGRARGMRRQKPVHLVEHHQRLEAPRARQAPHPGEHLLEEHARAPARAPRRRGGPRSRWSRASCRPRLHPPTHVEVLPLAPRRERGRRDERVQVGRQIRALRRGRKASTGSAPTTSSGGSRISGKSASSDAVLPARRRCSASTQRNACSRLAPARPRAP
jgi:hypothetical protein